MRQFERQAWSHPWLVPVRIVLTLGVVLLIAAPSLAATMYADLIPPARVNRVVLGESGNDHRLTWDPVTLDVLGSPETVDRYRIYRGGEWGFEPDRENGSNRIGESEVEEFLDVGAWVDGASPYFYKVSAVDPAGNESNTRPAVVGSASDVDVTTAGMTATVSWFASEPASLVGGYYLLWGTASGEYEWGRDVGNVTLAEVDFLSPGETYFFGVLPYDFKRHVHLIASEGGGTMPSGPTYPCQSGSVINTSSTWTLAGNPYIVDCYLKVAADAGSPTAVLTIRPGVEVQFVKPAEPGGNGRYLAIGAGGAGALVADGLPGTPILFTSDQKAGPGDWAGIRFDEGTDGASSIMDNCIVEYGGKTVGVTTSPAVRLSGVSPTFRNCTFRNNLREGILGSLAGSSPVIEGCTFSGNAEYDVEFVASTDALLTGNTFGNAVNFSDTGGLAILRDNTFENYYQDDGGTRFVLNVSAGTAGLMTGNTFTNADTGSYIHILAETVGHDSLWVNHDGVEYYWVTGPNQTRVEIQGSAAPTLTIEPGVTMRFSGGIRVGDNGPGALVAMGTPAEPITFSSSSCASQPTDTFWRGLSFRSQTVSAETILKHCIVECGGSNNPANIDITSASPTIENCEITDGKSEGISLDRASPTIRFNNITDNDNYGVEIGYYARPRVHHNNLVGNGDGAIHRLLKSYKQHADARYNWFGDASGPSGAGPGTGAVIFAERPVEFEPWLSEPFTSDNYVAELFRSTPVFPPHISHSKFSGEIFEDSTWTLTIEYEEIVGDPVIVRTITGSGDQLAEKFFGRTGPEITDPVLPDREYTYRFDAVGNTTSAPTAQLVGRVTLNNSLAIAEVDLPGHLETFAKGGDPVDVVGKATGVNFSTYELQYGPGRFPKSDEYENITPITSTEVPYGVLGSWNLQGLDAGTYQFRLRVKNSSGHTTEVNFGAYVLGIIDGYALSVDHGSFSPNGDGIKDDVTATAILTTPAEWTLNVVRVSTSEVVRTFTGSHQVIAETWDGMQDAGGLAPEDEYRWELTATQGDVVLNESVTTFLDLTPPNTNISDPTQGQYVFDDVVVLGQADDPADRFDSYLLEFGESSTPQTFVEINSGATEVAAGGVLGTWLTNDNEPVNFPPNGFHQLRLTATDQAGNSAIATREVNLDNLELMNVMTEVSSFDTSLYETARISYANDTIICFAFKIYPEEVGESGDAVYTNEMCAYEGSHELTWWGIDDLAQDVPDGAYIYVIDAYDFDGRTEKYAPTTEPEDPGVVGVGSQSDWIPASYNPYINQPLVVGVNNWTPARLTMTVEPSGGTLFKVFELVPYEATDGEPYEFVWDGRYPSGQIVEVSSNVRFPVPTSLPPDNYLIKTGDTPNTADLVSAPYLITMSYGQVSTFSFTLNRDADVTVAILPPGVFHPDDSAGYQLVQSQSMAAGTHEVSFDPTDLAHPHEAMMLFSDEGLYTFAIKAVNAVSGTTTVTRGALTMRQ